MKIPLLILSAWASCISSSFNPLKGGSQATSTIEARLEVTEPSKFNPEELLDSRSRKPELYNKAMLELKRLEEEPVCHRIAVQLLMNNCQGLEENAEGDYHMHGAKLQRHHVESFAASLAICDLERGAFVLPHACASFTSSALRASHEVKGKLIVSPEQVGGCLVALGQDHSHWNTWLSYRDKALLFCRASRLDIDKDEAIFQHKKLTEIMAEFSDGLEEDLRHIKVKMAEHARSTDSYFEAIKSHTEHLKAKLHVSMDSITSDFKEAAASVQNTVTSSTDLHRMLKTLVDTVMQTNSDMAAVHESSLSLNAKKTKSEFDSLTGMAVGAEMSVAALKLSIDRLFPAIVSLAERQDSLHQKSEVLESAIITMTSMIHNQTDGLEQASLTAFKIHSTLAEAAEAAKATKTPFGGSYIDWFLRGGGAVAGVLLGGHGITTTAKINMALAGFGYAITESIIQVQHFGRSSWRPWPWRSESASGPRSFTQKVQNVPVLELVEFETHNNMA